MSLNWIKRNKNKRVSSSTAAVGVRVNTENEITHKFKFRPVTGHEVSERECRYSSTLSSTSALQGLVKTTARHFYTRERVPVPLVEKAGWAPGPVGTRAENSPQSEFDPRTVQSVASR
jgi:hypothetical protein